MKSERLIPESDWVGCPHCGKRLKGLKFRCPYCGVTFTFNIIGVSIAAALLTSLVLLGETCN